MSKNGLNWTQEEVDAHLRKFKGDNRVAVPVADLESDSSHAAKTADAGQKVDQKFRIHFHSRRRRFIDPDGLYSKSAIDGVREGGIFADDSAKYIEGISYSQELAEVEETVLTVVEVTK
jgi:hypothetical protein